MVMAGQYQVQDFQDALVMTSFQKKPWAKATGSGVVAGLAFALLMNHYFERTPIVIASMLFGLLGAMASLRAPRAELRITKHEFQMRGTYGPTNGTFRTLNAVEVLGFSYLPYLTEGEDGSYPGGLYALAGSRSVCLLPYIDQDDVVQIADRIRTRYPHMSWLRVYEEN